MNKRIFWWCLAIIWCVFIFYQSGKPGTESDKSSQKIVQVVNQVSEKVLGPGKLVITDHVVRKTAHFLEYFILGLLLFCSFSSKGKLLRAFGLALLTGVIYASSDEIHQSFVPGRGPAAFDVLIDSTGVFAGISVLCLKQSMKKYIIRR